LEQAKSERLEFSLAFLDLDHLKSVNDNFGHQEGDWYIRSVASLISRFLRENDSAGRLGGDEFALIFPGYSSEQAETVLRQIEQELSELTEELVKPYRLGFSSGVVFVGAGTRAKSEELLNQADTLMYQHKKMRHLNK
jgi:diguanylate cyclase (GGDEF)-like protein